MKELFDLMIKSFEQEFSTSWINNSQRWRNWSRCES